MRKLSRRETQRKVAAFAAKYNLANMHDGQIWDLTEKFMATEGRRIDFSAAREKLTEMRAAARAKKRPPCVDFIEAVQAPDEEFVKQVRQFYNCSDFTLTLNKGVAETVLGLYRKRTPLNKAEATRLAAEFMQRVEFFQQVT